MQRPYPLCTAVIGKATTCADGQQVLHTTALDGFDGDEVARLAACVERGASHPLAAAVVGLAAGRGLPLTATVSDSREVPGQVRRSCRDAEVKKSLWQCDC